MERGLVAMSGAWRLARACIGVALIAGMLTVQGSSPVSAQGAADCEVTDLGTLGAAPGSVLEATGRWTTEDCDSRFRAGSDAHTYRFEVAEAGRIRIDLSSAEADPYLYLIAEGGSRLGFNDDGGVSLAARIERDLAPGAYVVEATTSTGRERGPADFALVVSRVAGCDVIHLGELKPGADLTASGSWTRNTCGSRIEVEHPATTYSFTMAEPARVRIDLESQDGNTVVSLASLSDGVIGANDDGGENRNSRIDKLLPADFYFIEATTYWERDFHALTADYTLTVHIIDERAEQQAHKLKIEAVHVPPEVVSGDPFEVHFRVGNLGGELPAGAYARLYVLSRGIYERGPRIRNIWQPGASYHTGDVTASANSTEIAEVPPVEIVLNRAGSEAVKVFVLTFNSRGREIGYRFFSQPVTVLSGPTFGPVNVSVDDGLYAVTAEANENGRVTTSVHPASRPDAAVDWRVRLRAVYTAGVLTQLLDGVFERPAIAALPTEAAPAPIDVADPSPATLRRMFAQQYLAGATTPELAEALAAREALNPITIEDWVLDAADQASSHYAAMAQSWRALERRIDRGAVLSFAEARMLQSQVNHAESIAAAAIAAGETVDAARAADQGWEDDEVQAMMAEQAACRLEESALRDAFKSAGAEGIEESGIEELGIEGLLALDAEMRAIRPVYGLAVDGALCAIAATADSNSRFLQRLSLGYSRYLRDQLGLVASIAEPSTPEPHRLRIIARAMDFGHLEFGVELMSGEQILPPERLLNRHAVVTRWQLTGDVEVDGTTIGRIQGRRLGGGRFEMGFVGADGEPITPDIAYLPADLPVGVWYRSGEIEVEPSRWTTAAESERVLSHRPDYAQSAQ